MSSEKKYFVLDLKNDLDWSGALPMCEKAGNTTGRLGHSEGRKASKVIRREREGTNLAMCCDGCVDFFLDIYGLRSS